MVAGPVDGLSPQVNADRGVSAGPASAVFSVRPPAHFPRVGYMAGAGVFSLG